MLSRKNMVVFTCVLAMLICAAAVALAGDKKAEVVTAGAVLGEAPEVSLADALKDPEKFVGKTVIVAGVAAEICQKKGCWMRVAPEGAEASVRMTFKDYGFFVPMDAAGMMVRAEGVFEMKVLDKDHAEHLDGEGAKIELNEDGTANEFGFVATGVELSGEKLAVAADAKVTKHEGCTHEDHAKCEHAKQEKCTKEDHAKCSHDGHEACTHEEHEKCTKEDHEKCMKDKAKKEMKEKKEKKEQKEEKDG